MYNFKPAILKKMQKYCKHVWILLDCSHFHNLYVVYFEVTCWVTFMKNQQMEWSTKEELNEQTQVQGEQVTSEPAQKILKDASYWIF